METNATFRLTGDNEPLTAAAVTTRLGLRPTTAFEAGTAVGPRSGRLRGYSFWALEASPTIASGVELAEQLHKLLDQLEPLSDELWALARQGYEANWFCFVASHATEHAVELDRRTMERLLRLPGDLWLDVCGDDLEGSPTA